MIPDWNASFEKGQVEKFSVVNMKLWSKYKICPIWCTRIWKGKKEENYHLLSLSLARRVLRCFTSMMPCNPYTSPTRGKDYHSGFLVEEMDSEFNSLPEAIHLVTCVVSKVTRTLPSAMVKTEKYSCKGEVQKRKRTWLGKIDCLWRYLTKRIEQLLNLLLREWLGKIHNPNNTA